MFYIHHTVCISPQLTFPESNMETLMLYDENKLYTKEPSYEHIPNAVLRRMGKIVKLSVAAAMPIFKIYDKLDGIIIGTANGGMEDCIKFLNQIMEYEEGVLTPTNFVQSTTNAVAGQFGFFSKNKGYNITHVHRGLAFENAIIDVAMLLSDNPQKNYLLGGLDEISDYNFNIDYLGGWYKKELISNDKLYSTKTEGSIAGEGVSLFVVNNTKENASSQLRAIKTIHSIDNEEISNILKAFIQSNVSENESIDLFLSGENGDIRYDNFYESCESLLSNNVSIARYKHMSGEYQTSTAFALWLSDIIIQTQNIPAHMIKKDAKNKKTNTILIYNNYQGLQHSFMLLSKV